MKKKNTRKEIWDQWQRGEKAGLSGLTIWNFKHPSIRGDSVTAFPLNMIDLFPDLSENGVSLLKQWAKIITLTKVNENRTVSSNLLQSVLMAEDLCPPNATYSD